MPRYLRRRQLAHSIHQIEQSLQFFGETHVIFSNPQYEDNLVFCFTKVYYFPMYLFLITLVKFETDLERCDKVSEVCSSFFLYIPQPFSVCVPSPP